MYGEAPPDGTGLAGILTVARRARFYDYTGGKHRTPQLHTRKYYPFALGGISSGAPQDKIFAT